MELEQQSIDFEPENCIEIGGVHFIVATHFDDSQETLQAKFTRILQKEIKNQASHL
jgi:hypothetical protein